MSTEPRYQESVGWYGTRALETLERALWSDGLRLCEACMAPRAWTTDGALVYETGPVGLDEVVRLDEQLRGDSLPARSAVWLDETRGGVAVRIVDLHNGRVLFARNVDPWLTEQGNTRRAHTLAAELERRQRGDSLTQSFVDLAVYPKQHIAIEWTDQWGATNANLSGFTLTVLDPALGLGAVHYRRLPLLNTLVGAKIAVSIPTMIVRNFNTTDSNISSDFLDPLLTAVGVIRVPFGRSNYGALLTVSTNGRVAFGISLLNIRTLPLVL